MSAKISSLTSSFFQGQGVSSTDGLARLTHGRCGDESSVNSTCALVQLLLCPPIFASCKRRFDIGALFVTIIIKSLRQNRTNPPNILRFVNLIVFGAKFYRGMTNPCRRILNGPRGRPNTAG